MRHLRSSLIIALACAALILGVAHAAPSTSSGQALYDANALPSGDVGDSIRLGHDIMADPKKYLPKNVVADLTCESCHVNGGTVKRGGSFMGTYARFPQWNKRAKRVIMLQDRLAECFLPNCLACVPDQSDECHRRRKRSERENLDEDFYDRPRE